MMMAFIAVAGVLLYTWIVYPALMLWLGRGQRAVGSGQGAVGSGQNEVENPSPSSYALRLTSHISLPTSPPPRIAIVLSAHNEEAVIQARLENLANLDYPADRLHVFVGIDGGSDRTAEIAMEWGRSHSNVYVVLSANNNGKTAMLKRLVGLRWASSFESNVSLLVFTDANTMFAPDALRRLVAPFADPKVGGVCGKLVFVRGVVSGSRHQATEENAPHPNPLPRGEREWRNVTEENAPQGGRSLLDLLPRPLWERVGMRGSFSSDTDESTYWNLETRLKVAESSLDSCLGANGAVYAIRASLFPEYFPDNTIIDDFVIGMKVREQGYRMVYEPAAIATEELPATVDAEWRRRVRIGSGAYQALALCWRCLLPRYKAFAWMFWSHKVLRWFTPHFGIVLLVMGCWLLSAPSPLVGEGWGEGLFILVVFSFGAAVLLLTRLGRKALKLVSYFITMQAALFVGFLRYCRGGLKGSWGRTERGDPPLTPPGRGSRK